MVELANKEGDSSFHEALRAMKVKFLKYKLFLYPLSWVQGSSSRDENSPYLILQKIAIGWGGPSEANIGNGEKLGLEYECCIYQWIRNDEFHPIVEDGILIK